MQRQPWVEHTFNLDIHPGWAQNILSRLGDMPIRIRHHCEGLSEEQLSQKLDGTWSMKEQIGHLIDLEALHSNRLDQFARFIDVLEAADMKNAKTEAANHNETPIVDLLEQLTSVRSAFIAKFKSLSDQVQSHQAMHPRLQVLMRPVDVLFFTAEHDDHHISSMLEVKSKLMK